MMKRKISLIAFMITCTIFVQAQEKTTRAGATSFGIRGGVNFQNINGKDEEGIKLDGNILTAYSAGVNVEIPIAPDFYFQPGLLYSVKGSKATMVILNETINSSIKISYLEMPLNFLYKPLLGSGHLLLGFGPYIAYGIGGKINYDGTYASSSTDIKFKNDVKLSDADNVAYIKPFDAGANLLAGYEFSNKLSFQLNVQLGMLKINPTYEGTTNDKATAKNTGFGLSLGYRF